jgi:hypothetical protein
MVSCRRFATLMVAVSPGVLAAPLGQCGVSAHAKSRRLAY